MWPPVSSCHSMFRQISMVELFLKMYILSIFSKVFNIKYNALTVNKMYPHRINKTLNANSQSFSFKSIGKSHDKKQYVLIRILEPIRRSR